MNTGDPSGVVRGSTATERPGVSGTPSAPRGPPSASGIWRKNTKLGSLLNGVSRSMPVNLRAGSFAALADFISDSGRDGRTLDADRPAAGEAGAVATGALCPAADDADAAAAAGHCAM